MSQQPQFNEKHSRKGGGRRSRPQDVGCGVGCQGQIDAFGPKVVGIYLGDEDEHGSVAKDAVADGEEKHCKRRRLQRGYVRRFCMEKLCNQGSLEGEANQASEETDRHVAISGEQINGELGDEVCAKVQGQPAGGIQELHLCTVSQQPIDHRRVI